MKKIIKLFYVIMFVSACLMTGLSGNYQEKQNDLTLRDLIISSTANAEDFPNWMQGCIPCEGGTIFICIPASGPGCFSLPCSGGYC